MWPCIACAVSLTQSGLALARVIKFPLAVLGLVRKTGFTVPFAV